MENPFLTFFHRFHSICAEPWACLPPQMMSSATGWICFHLSCKTLNPEPALPHHWPIIVPAFQDSSSSRGGKPWGHISTAVSTVSELQTIQLLSVWFWEKPLVLAFLQKLQKKYWNLSFCFLSECHWVSDDELCNLWGKTGRSKKFHWFTGICPLWSFFLFVWATLPTF